MVTGTMPTTERAAKALACTPRGLFVGGTWRDAVDGSRFDVENPATGAVLASVASAGAADAAAAMDAAATAQVSWAKTPARERAEILRRGYDLVVERREELAALMTLEMGKPFSEALGEVVYGGEFLRWFSEEAARSYGRYGESPEGSLRVVVTRRPVGPCLLVTPWNFPLAMATRKIAPAVAAGCTMILKPAELTPLTALYFTEVMIDAGLPAGVLNVLPTVNPGPVSATLLADRRLRKLSFTGSTAVGRQLLKLAADNVVRTSMELGGNAPLIVFEDADIDRAVDGAMAAKLRNMGEACTAANRLIVHESVAEEFTQRLAARFDALSVGDGLIDGIQVGPVIDAKAQNNILSLVQDAVERGATIVAGGKPVEGPGYFVEPTLLGNVAPGSRVLTEEIFGPLAPIVSFSSEDEAIEMASDTEYGLASYVFTNDLARGLRVAERLEFGMLGLNLGVISNASAPFGGMKQSGLGREGGAEGIEEYLATQYVGLAR